MYKVNMTDGIITQLHSSAISQLYRIIAQKRNQMRLASLSFLEVKKTGWQTTFWDSSLLEDKIGSQNFGLAASFFGWQPGFLTS